MVIDNMTGQEGIALILKNDGKVYKSTTPSAQNIIGFLGRIVSGTGDSINNNSTGNLAHVIGIGDSFEWEENESVNSEGEVTKNWVKIIKGVKVCNEGGNIAPGDLLVTSSKPGYFMKQADDIIRSSTAAKCLQDVIFSDTTEQNEIYCVMMCG